MSATAANGSATGTRPAQPAPTAVPDAYEELRAAALGEVSHRGVDLSDGPAVASMVGALVDAYQARAQAGLGGRALADPTAMKARLRRALVGHGPLGRFLSGEQVVEEVVIVGGDVAYIDADGRWVMLDEAVTEAEMRSVIDRLLAGVGASVDAANPMVQTQILDGAGRIGVVIPPIADRLNACLRWNLPRHETLAKLVGWETLPSEAASLLAACMLTPTGLVFTGKPSSGKTSLANAAVRACPDTLRVICCEDTPEIDPAHLSPFRWRTRRPGPDDTGEVTLRDLVRMALGMRPDLIVVGEVRGAEAYELTRAGNAGCGLVTTVHANSARAGLQALMSTAVMAGQNVDSAQVRAVFCSIVDLVVHLDREPLDDVKAGRVRRQVMEMAAVPPLQGAEADFTIEPLFVRDHLGA
ncbi:MAG: ATPase, T2SS/T4P/T4SS family, partial [Acidimicrobiales bacterium]